MKIRNQFIISAIVFGVILLIFATWLAITNIQISRLNRQRDITIDIERRATELAYLSNDYFIFGENRQVRQWESSFASLSDNIANLKPESPEQQRAVNNIKENQRRLKTVFTDTITAFKDISQADSVTAQRLIQVSWSRIAVQNQGLFFEALNLQQLLKNRIDVLRQTDILLSFFIIGLFSLYYLTNYFLTYRHMLGSIAKLRAGTEIVGRGNLEYRIGMPTKDELGELARSFDSMTENLHMTIVSRDALQYEVAERKKAEKELGERVRISEERAEKLAILNEITTTTTTTTTTTLSQRVLDILGGRLGIVMGTLLEVNEERNELTPIAIYGYPAELFKSIPPVKIDSDTESTRVFKSGKPAIVENVDTYAMADASKKVSLKKFEELSGKPLKSYIGLPLTAYQKTIGMISLGWSAPRAFTQEDIDFFTSIAYQIAFGLTAMQTLEAAASKKATEK